jgi:hypothetical protein
MMAVVVVLLVGDEVMPVDHELVSFFFRDEDEA